MGGETPRVPSVADVMRRLGLAPCKGCTNRRVGCHGECEKYQAALSAAREKHDEIERELAKDRLAEGLIARGYYIRKQKYKRRWGKK